jgi:hypothetical protein
LDKCLFGPLKSYLQNADAAWMKQTPERKITRYHMARLIGFALNKAASMDVDVSAVESTGIYPLKRNRVPEYFFSISDASEKLKILWKHRLHTWFRFVQLLLQEPTLKMCYISLQDLHYVL